MALRVRRNGSLICAALNPKKEGDVYIDDAVHSLLCRKKLIVTYPEPSHTATGGVWWWKGEEPFKDRIDPFWYIEVTHV